MARMLKSIISTINNNLRIASSFFYRILKEADYLFFILNILIRKK